ncbi:MAG: glutamate--tRNA ligase [Anaerolineales bacterium]|nr:glutamate--tRNA ligase [Anaerolineales bacterium]
MSSEPPVRVRFAPSPTGRFHIGGARTALYDYLIARQTGGQFILRIEDTDQKRFDPAAEAEIIESLHWLGMDWDEGPDIGGPYGPYRQSERKQSYQAHAETLLARGHAYRCFCSPERLAQRRQAQQQAKQSPRYDGLCRKLDPAESQERARRGESHVIRFKTPPAGTTTAIDLIRGPITVENSDLDDYILMKSNGLPVYHLAAIVDDRLMRISHVLRGSEWLPTFPLHVLLYQAFGWEQPQWVHLSVFLNPAGKGKMSKRQAIDAKGGAQTIYPLDLRQAGYLPEAVVNWIALMGWSFDDHTEFFSLPDLIRSFSLAKLTPSPAAVNFTKLDHFNGLHIRALTVDDLTRRLVPVFQAAGLSTSETALRRVTPLIQERIRTLEEAVEIAGFFFRESLAPPTVAMLPIGVTAPAGVQALQRSSAVVAAVPQFTPEALEAALRQLAEQLGLTAAQLFSLLRVATTGQTVSPPLVETMVILGSSLVTERLEAAARQLAN